MSFGEDLYGFLVGAGTSLGDRLYPVELAQPASSFPAATYQRIEAPRMYSHSGDSNVVTVAVQINVYDLDYDAAYIAGKEVIDALSGNTSGPWQRCLLILDRDGPRETDTELYSRQLEFEFIWKES